MGKGGKEKHRHSILLSLTKRLKKKRKRETARAPSALFDLLCRLTKKRGERGRTARWRFSFLLTAALEERERKGGGREKRSPDVPCRGRRRGESVESVLCLLHDFLSNKMGRGKERTFAEEEKKTAELHLS